MPVRPQFILVPATLLTVPLNHNVLFTNIEIWETRAYSF